MKLAEATDMNSRTGLLWASFSLVQACVDSGSIGTATATGGTSSTTGGQAAIESSSGGTTGGRASSTGGFGSPSDAGSSSNGGEEPTAGGAGGHAEPSEPATGGRSPSSGGSGGSGGSTGGDSGASALGAGAGAGGQSGTTDLVTQTLADCGLEVSGGPSVQEYEIPVELTDANWGNKQLQCSGSGWDLSRCAGAPAEFNRFDTGTTDAAGQPVLLWVVTQEDTVCCVYKSDSSLPGIYGVSCP
jgi:hypothetical protein